MQIEGIGQYLTIAAAIGFLILLKYWVLRKRVAKQIDEFLHPSLFVKQIERQISNPQNAENLLTNYTNNSQKSNDRFRNIALLVAYINSKQYIPKNKRLLLELINNSANLSANDAKYREYIKQNIVNWE